MKKIIKYMDKKLFIAILILFSFGLIMIFSASNVTAYMYGLCEEDICQNDYIYNDLQFPFIVTAFLRKKLWKDKILIR